MTQIWVVTLVTPRSKEPPMHTFTPLLLSGLLLSGLLLAPHAASARTILWEATSGVVPWDGAIAESARFEVIDQASFASLTPMYLRIDDDTVPARIVSLRDEPIGTEWAFQIDVRVVSAVRPEPSFAVSSSIHDGEKVVSLGITPDRVGFVGPNGASWIEDATYAMNTTDIVHRYDVQKVGATVRLFIDGSASPALEIPIGSYLASGIESVSMFATSIAGTSEFHLERYQVETGLAPTSVGPALRGSTLSAAPNPFRPTTSVRFVLHAGGPVELDVFDARGRRIRRLAQAVHGAGALEVLWNGRDDAGDSVAAGSYWIRLVAEGRSVTERVVRLR